MFKKIKSISKVQSLIRNAYNVQKRNNAPNPYWKPEKTFPDPNNWLVRHYYDHSTASTTGPIPLDEELVEELKKLWDMIVNNTDEHEVWLAGKSPSFIAKLAISNKKRLSPEAEKIIIEKAGEKGSFLLEYCNEFGIVLKEMTKITMKASFDNSRKSRFEKNYIKKMLERKAFIKRYLTELINAEEVDPNKSVKELVESI